jgi:hypothetical protein
MVQSSVDGLFKVSDKLTYAWIVGLLSVVQKLKIKGDNSNVAITKASNAGKDYGINNQAQIVFHTTANAAAFTSIITFK